HKRSQLFIRTHNETLSIAMCVGNEKENDTPNFFAQTRNQIRRSFAIYAMNSAEATTSGSEVRKLLSRRRRACVSRLTEPLPWRCSRRLLSGMLDRIVSYHDQFAAKWRRRFRREKRP